MRTSDAVELIRNDQPSEQETWCDLGCGSGTFTIALAELVAPGSTIWAVDVDARQISGIPEQHRGVKIRKVVADIAREELPVSQMDGILMANALHFIKDQATFLARVNQATKKLLIVEYENRLPSPWGPYPVNSARFREMARKAGFSYVEKLRTMPSRFGGTLYSALAER
jgi:ubiquinone/menaquinone biosynthesis C-methylase UbiE